MPIIKSAIKRVRQTKTRTQRNRVAKNKFRTLVKEFQTLVSDKKLEEAARLFPQVQQAIDFATKKKILHKNNAARQKSNLSKLIRDAGVAGVKAHTAQPEKKKESTPKAEKPATKKKATPKKK